MGGATEFRIRKSGEDGGGTAFADYVWKPVVLMEMKKRGTDLQKHYRHAFDYWMRLVPNRPRFRAVATPVHDLGNPILTHAESATLQKSLENMRTREERQAAIDAFLNTVPLDTTPFQFRARWDFLHLIGSAIKMNMVTDSFYPDPAVVAEVKAAVARNAFEEISAILDRAAARQ